MNNVDVLCVCRILLIKKKLAELRVLFLNMFQKMSRWKGPIFAKGLWQKEKKARWAGHYFGLGAEPPIFHDR